METEEHLDEGTKAHVAQIVARLTKKYEAELDYWIKSWTYRIKAYQWPVWVWCDEENDARICDEVIVWLNEHCGVGMWAERHGEFGFHTEIDALHFKVRWN